MGRNNGSSGNNHDNDEFIKLYLSRIGEFPLLTREEEIRYGRILKSKTVSEKEKNQARKKFILSNLRLVVSIAKVYKSNHLTIMDIIQEGTIGLMRAVEKFNPEMGNKFSTYASHWIKQFIARAIAEKSDLIDKPIYMQERLTAYRKGFEVLWDKYNRAPSEDEIFRYFKKERGWTVTNTKCVQVADKLSNIVSLDIKSGLEDTFKLFEEQDSIEERIVKKIAGSALHKALHEAMKEVLTEREQKIIRLRILDGLTLEKVGAQIGVTRERVRQLQGKALAKLRYRLRAKGINNTIELHLDDS